MGLTLPKPRPATMATAADTWRSSATSSRADQAFADRWSATGAVGAVVGRDPDRRPDGLRQPSARTYGTDLPSVANSRAAEEAAALHAHRRLRARLQPLDRARVVAPIPDSARALPQLRWHFAFTSHDDGGEHLHLHGLVP